jgi:hypothetical protein
MGTFTRYFGSATIFATQIYVRCVVHNLVADPNSVKTGSGLLGPGPNLSPRLQNLHRRNLFGTEKYEYIEMHILCVNFSVHK